MWSGHYQKEEEEEERQQWIGKCWGGGFVNSCRLLKRSLPFQGEMLALGQDFEKDGNSPCLQVLHHWKDNHSSLLPWLQKVFWERYFQCYLRAAQLGLEKE